MRRALTLGFGSILALAMLAGCAAKPLAAWERGRMARASMQADPFKADARTRRQIHASKEGIAGDLAPAGGGCGCN